ncbi:MAG: glutathione S-transferase N-terminal domain-containing protein [Schwartzia sp.]|nr:glutathione S-transferase N-terminal domain-containing protein [Schwartzia sp. (in: firmicutes)]
MVKVYSINDCPWCEKVKKYLKSKNVEFEEHNIEENDEDRNACYKLTGDLVVPITTVNDKDYVLSFDKEKLDAMLGL